MIGDTNRLDEHKRHLITDSDRDTGEEVES